MSKMRTPESVIMHVMVVGFHHKKGCQVEYCYPPLDGPSTQKVEDTGSGAAVHLPEEWKHLPTLALPDGAHNYGKDAIYFHLKNRGDAAGTVFGISCYQQMDAKQLVNRTADITRATVQKSVCVLSRLPLYGAVRAKLELITRAYFEQKDFTAVGLLQDTYSSLTSAFGIALGSAMTDSQLLHGLNVQEVVQMYKHKVLVLFKLMLLERRVLFFMTPVADLCNILLSVLSLFPGMIERGLMECLSGSRSSNDTTSVHRKSRDDFAQGKSATTGDVASVHHAVHASVDGQIQVPEVSHLLSHQHTHRVQDGAPSSVLITFHSQPATCYKLKADKVDDTSQTIDTDAAAAPMDDASAASCSDKQALQLEAGTVSVGNALLLEIDREEDKLLLWPEVDCGTLELVADDTVSEDSGNDKQCSSSEKAVLSSLPAGISASPPGAADITGIEHRLPESSAVFLPVQSPTSLVIDDAGFPLAIFTKGSICHPYLSLAYYDVLEDVHVRSFVIGASNILFRQKKHNLDVIVEDDESRVHVADSELKRQLQLTTADLRFADELVRAVEDRLASQSSGNSADGETEWEGSDDWLRAQFKLYLTSLMAAVLQDEERYLEDFNLHFVNAWKASHNYRVWRSTVVQLSEVSPRHPCHGSMGVSDVKLRLSRTIQGTERGRKLNAAMAVTGKVVGGALQNAKATMSNWWSGFSAAKATAAPSAGKP